MAEALGEGTRPPTQGRLAELCGIHRMTVNKALQREDVRAWLVTQLAVDDDWKTRKIMSRIAGQAIAGSKDHQRIWLELQGRLRSPFAPGAGDASKLGDGWSVTINVPMPPPQPIDVVALPASGTSL